MTSTLESTDFQQQIEKTSTNPTGHNGGNQQQQQDAVVPMPIITVEARELATKVEWLCSAFGSCKFVCISVGCCLPGSCRGETLHCCAKAS
jgi:hypothetical protein